MSYNNQNGESLKQQQEKLKPSRANRGSFVVTVIIATVLVAVLFLFVVEVANNRSEIRRNNEALEAIKQEERLLALENEQLESYANGENFDEFIERHARDDMGYADPQERVFRVN